MFKDPVSKPMLAPRMGAVVRGRTPEEEPPMSAHVITVPRSGLPWVVDSSVRSRRA